MTELIPDISARRSICGVCFGKDIRGWLYYDGVFSTRFVYKFNHFSNRSIDQLFVDLGHFATNEYLSISKGRDNVSQHVPYPVGRLEDDEGSRLRRQGVEPFFSVIRPRRRKPYKRERAAASGHDHRSQNGAGTRNGLDRDPARNGITHQACAGVREERGAGIGDQGDRIPPLESAEKTGPLPGLIVPVEAGGRGRYAVVGQQLGGATCVLGGNDGDILLKHAEGPDRDVFQVSDRGGDDVERAGWVAGRWCHRWRPEERGRRYCTIL